MRNRWCSATKPITVTGRSSPRASPPREPTEDAACSRLVATGFSPVQPAGGRHCGCLSCEEMRGGGHARSSSGPDPDGGNRVDRGSCVRFRAVSLWFLRLAKVACGQIRGQRAQHLPAQLIPRFQPLRSPPPPEQRPQPAHGQKGQRGGLGCNVPGANGALVAPEVRGRMLRIADGGRRVRGHRFLRRQPPAARAGPSVQHRRDGAPLQPHRPHRAVHGQRALGRGPPTACDRGPSHGAGLQDPADALPQRQATAQGPMGIAAARP